MTSPIRTVISAIRPRLIIIGLERATNVKALVAVTGCSLFAASAAYAGASLLAASGAEVGTLTSIIEYPAICSAAVAGSLVSQYFSALSRGFVRLNVLVAARVVVSILTVLIITGSALRYGPLGALGAFAFMLMVESVLWLVMINIHKAEGVGKSHTGRS